MKLGFIGMNDLAGLEADARFAADHGFAGLEFNYWGNFAELTAETVGQMRDLLDRYGVGCSALGLWGWNHLSENDSERETAREMLGRAIDFAVTLGAETLISGGGTILGAGVAENAAEFVKFFPPYLERLQNAGIRPAMYAVHGASFFVRLEAYEAVWETMPEIGIKYDPANWRHAGLDYLEVVRRYGDKVAYVHIKEHIYDGDQVISQPAAGMGDIAWGKVLAFLYEHDYRGYLSMEPHGDVWGWGPKAATMRNKMLLLSQKYLDQFLLP